MAAAPGKKKGEVYIFGKSLRAIGVSLRKGKY